MRIRRALSLALLTAALSAFAASAASGSASLPGSGYVWAQPWAPVVACPYAQPPASIRISPAVHATPGSGYVWAQPWATLVGCPHAQPPAWIPTG
jgi:hypothetical protein